MQVTFALICVDMSVCSACFAVNVCVSLVNLHILSTYNTVPQVFWLCRQLVKSVTLFVLGIYVAREVASAVEESASDVIS